MNDDWVIERKKEQKQKLSFLNDMYVEKGTIEDWRLLESLHYKQTGKMPLGAHEWRLVLNGETIGVIVMAAPKLLIKERHLIFPKLKPGGDNKITNKKRMRWLNDNMQIVARVVVDTMYRGAGIAYRFLNLACRLEGKRFLEIQSSMSKYNLFAQKAGFRFVKPMKPSKYAEGIKFFSSTFEANPADIDAIMNEFLSLSESEQRLIDEKARKWYLRHSMLENTGKFLNGLGAEHVKKMSIREVIQQIQQMTLMSPLYGVYQNPDYNRKDLPEKLPLLAFDYQTPYEPLKLEMLKWSES